MEKEPENEEKKEKKTTKTTKGTSNKNVEKTKTTTAKKTTKDQTTTKKAVTKKESEEDLKKEVSEKAETKTEKMLVKKSESADENKKEEKVKTKSGNIFLGIIGGILGGIVASVPWILMYIYGDMISSALSILIALGVLYGYKLFNGKKTKSLPAIIMITSLLVVVAVTLVAIPMLLLFKTGKTINFEEFKLFYTNKEYLEALTKDSVISIIFTLFGAGVIVSNVRRQIKNESIEGNDVDKLDEAEKNNAIKLLKPVFEKFNALSKEHGILKDELKAELDSNEKKEALKLLKSYKIVKKSNGRFYYDVEVEENKAKPKKKIAEKVITIIVGLALIVAMVAVMVIDKVGVFKKIVVNDENVSFVVKGGWEEYTSYYDTGYSYFKYINSEELPEGETEEEGDYSHYPALLNITTYQMDVENLTSIDEIKESMKEYVDGQEEKPAIYEENVSKNDKGYDILTLKMQYEGDLARVEYVYYIINVEKVAIIDGYSFTVEDSSEIEKTVNEIVKSFSWVN